MHGTKRRELAELREKIAVVVEDVARTSVGASPQEVRLIYHALLNAAYKLTPLAAAAAAAAAAANCADCCQCVGAGEREVSASASSRLHPHRAGRPKCTGKG